MSSKQVDYKLFFAVVALIIVWMVMISSVSVYSSYKVTSQMVTRWEIAEAYNHFYVLRNIIHVCISMALLWVIVKIPYTYYEKYAKYIFLACLALLVFVLIYWEVTKWAKWWINFKWLPFTIQPTEFLKLWFIIFLAYFFKKYRYYIWTFEKWFLPFMCFLWIVTLLVWLQPDFWTIMVIAPVAVIMFFLAWADLRYILALFLCWLALVFSIYFLWARDTWKEGEHSKFWYITQRIDNYLTDEKTAIEDNTINRQTKQWLIAIWSGWFFGLGFGNSIQKFGYLPEVQWDFIFSVICEELGFLWWLLLVLLYLFIAYRWMYIATHSHDLFARYLAVWFTSRFCLQAFINIGVTLNIVPLTWLTLPFISYGWSSLLSCSIWLAILLNVSRFVEKKPYFDKDLTYGRWRKIMNIFSRV